MKYRRLSKSELEELEAEFIQFLVANTVTGEDWIKIKAEHPERAENLIELFSDIVFDKTLDKIEYLEHKTDKELRCFHCQAEKIIMLGLVAQETKDFDFRENLPANQMISRIKADGGTIQFFSAEKKYKGDRKMELYRMMENGCLISKGNLFQILHSVQPG